MISNEIQSLLLEQEGNELIINSENVANVNCNNNLYHALLVLSQVNYSTIPVLDNQSHIRGMISMPMIIKAIIGIDSIRFEEMEKMKVKEVMRKEVPTVLHTADLEDILQKLTNHNFLCVVDEDDVFRGIITRKEILGRVNHLVHELHRRYDLTARDLAGIKK